MKNIRLFLQFALFVVIVAGAICLAPQLGQQLEDRPFESGLLSAPAIDHGHGDAHGETHGEEQGDTHGEPQDESHGEVHGQAPAGHAPAAAEAEAVTEVAAEAEVEAGAEAVEETVVEAEETAGAEAEATAEEVTEEVTEEAAEEVATEVATEVVEETPEPVAEVAEAAQPSPAHPGDLVIQSIDPATATQAPVAFSHTVHEGYECAFCHHKGGNVSCTSAGCHTDTSTKKLTGATENVSFEAAFHIKGDKSCVGCHRTLKAGPTSCKDCHPK